MVFVVTRGAEAFLKLQLRSLQVKIQDSDFGSGSEFSKNLYIAKITSIRVLDQKSKNHAPKRANSLAAVLITCFTLKI